MVLVCIVITAILLRGALKDPIDWRIMKRPTYRESCVKCKSVFDVEIGTMAECIYCKKLVCIDCACSEQDTIKFIKTTGHGKIIDGHKDPDMNGPCGWLCPICFSNQFNTLPEKPKWTNESPSSGEIAESGLPKEKSKKLKH